jgi:hypothetical protein
LERAGAGVDVDLRGALSHLVELARRNCT